MTTQLFSTSLNHLLGVAAIATLCVTSSTCADDDVSADGAGDWDDGGLGVGQGGAQDFGQFRSILDAGEIPSPDTLDDVGFFNEHKVELPNALCGNDVCIHGRLGVMGNLINGANCTMLLLGMNTPIDPTTLERPPLNLGIAVDTSGSMGGTKIAYVKEGLLRMLPSLEPGDHVTLVGFESTATVLATGEVGDGGQLAAAIGSIEAEGGTNIYDGLRTAYEGVAVEATADRQNRVILLSDGETNNGITNEAKLIQLAAGYGTHSIGLTSIGMGEGFQPELLRRLAEQGGGAFYFLEKDEAVAEVFEQEVDAFLVPLAEDVHVDVLVSEGYRLRAMYGTKIFETFGNRGTIDMPTLQIAGRTSPGDDEGGRRGGGGAIIVEVLPSGKQPSDPWHVGDVTMDYRIPGSEERVTETRSIVSPFLPGELPPDGHFDDPAVEKGFVMLNIYAGFSMAAGRAEMGDLRAALGILLALDVPLEAWLAANEDADILDDHLYVHRFIDNLRQHGAEDPPPTQIPPDPWPAD